MTDDDPIQWRTSNRATTASGEAFVHQADGIRSVNQQNGHRGPTDGRQFDEIS
jgi:hypothetical protein